jgi:CrcB protein
MHPAWNYYPKPWGNAGRRVFSEPEDRTIAADVLAAETSVDSADIGAFILEKLLLVGAGGFLGSVARYLLCGWVQQLCRESTFPYGTMAVNLLGCFLIGVLAQLSESRGIPSSEARLFLTIGLLGGFTTFSTFSVESLQLLREGQSLAAAAYIGGHVVLSLLVAWAGMVAANCFWR